MRIAIDTRDLQIAKTGSRTYLEELCRAFSSIGPEHEFIFLQPKRRIFPGKSPFMKILNHLAFYWWKEIELPWLAWHNKSDLLFCTDYVVPLIAHCPTVPVFYDANFWANPDQYNYWWRKLMDIFAVPAAKKSYCVVTISEFSRQEISRYTDIAPENIKVIPIGPKSVTTTDETLTQEEMDNILRHYGIDTDVPFVLHVGVLEKRKNLPRLVKAFALFLRENSLAYQLVLVGQAGPKHDMDDSPLIRSTIAELGLEDVVKIVGYVDDHDLVAFYRRADLFALPSLREGFGIPILEAFNNGVPVIAANSTAIPEVTGEAALLFAPQSIEDIAEAIRKVVTCQELRATLIELGYKQAALFSWDATAQRLVSLFTEIVSKV